jgi:hypothetical protein
MCVREREREREGEERRGGRGKGETRRTQTNPIDRGCRVGRERALAEQLSFRLALSDSVDSPEYPT